MSRYLPAEPLLAAIADLLDERDASESSLGETFRGAIGRARRAGTVTDTMADLLSIGVLGRHPMAVYGDAWLDGVQTGLDVEELVA